MGPLGISRGRAGSIVFLCGLWSAMHCTLPNTSELLSCDLESSFKIIRILFCWFVLKSEVVLVRVCGGDLRVYKDCSPLLWSLRFSLAA
jgi:hypothetical protein